MPHRKRVASGVAGTVLAPVLMVANAGGLDESPGDVAASGEQERSMQDTETVAAASVRRNHDLDWQRAWGHIAEGFRRALTEVSPDHSQRRLLLEGYHDACAVGRLAPLLALAAESEQRTAPARRALSQ